MSSEVKKFVAMFGLLWILMMVLIIFIVLAHKSYVPALYIGGGIVFVVARIVFWIRWRRQRASRRQVGLGREASH